MKNHNSPDELPALKEWNRILDRSDINWSLILENIFKIITNNNKLIQFQYKLLMRISTCKYMRYKMKIVKDNGQCSLCDESLETLEHIFLSCSHTKAFCDKLKCFIQNNIDREFRDRKKMYFVLCNHSNSVINYFNLTAKWYISKNGIRTIYPGTIYPGTIYPGTIYPGTIHPALYFAFNYRS